jgi:hypothetical protein
MKASKATCIADLTQPQLDSFKATGYPRLGLTAKAVRYELHKRREASLAKAKATRRMLADEARVLDRLFDRSLDGQIADAADEVLRCGIKGAGEGSPEHLRAMADFKRLARLAKGAP